MSQNPDPNEHQRQIRLRILQDKAAAAHGKAIEQTREMSEQLRQIPTDDTGTLPVDREQQYRWIRMAEEAEFIAGGWSQVAHWYNSIAEDIRKILDARDTAAWEEEQALGKIPPRDGRRREE